MASSARCDGVDRATRCAAIAVENPAMLVSCCRMRLAPFLLSLVCLVAAVRGQGDKPPVRSGAPAAGADKAVGEAGAAEKEQEKEKQKPQDEIPTKEVPPGAKTRPFVIGRDEKAEAEAKAKLPGAKSGHVTFDPTCRPRQIVPGEQGTVQVIMLLAGDAAMWDPPPVKFAFAPQQGPLAVLGEPKFRPSEPTGLAPGLKGQPAYDNYAVFDVPFAVDPKAEPGSHRLEVTVRYDLVNGQKGTPIGGFTDVVGFDVQVVASRKEPVALANGGTPAASSRGASPTGDSPTPPDAPRAEPAVGTSLVRGQADEVAVAEASKPEVAPSVDVAADDGGIGPSVLVAGIAIVALALILVRVRRA